MIPLGILSSRAAAAPPAGGPTLTLLDSYNASSIADPTTRSVVENNPSATRVILVVVLWGNNAGTGGLNRYPSGVTVDGSTMARDHRTSVADEGIGFWRREVPTGTAFDIVVDWNATGSKDHTILTYACDELLTLADTYTVLDGAGVESIAHTSSSGLLLAGVTAREIAGTVTLGTTTDDYLVGHHGIGHSLPADNPPVSVGAADAETTNAGAVLYTTGA